MRESAYLLLAFVFVVCLMPLGPAIARAAEEVVIGEILPLVGHSCHRGITDPDGR